MIAYGYNLEEIINIFKNNNISNNPEFIIRELDNLNTNGYLVFDSSESCKSHAEFLVIGNNVVQKMIEEYNNYKIKNIIPPINPDIKYDNDISLIQQMKREGTYASSLIKSYELLENGQFCENLCMSIYKVLACSGQTDNAFIAVKLAILIAKANQEMGLLYNDQMHLEKLISTINDEESFKLYLESISGNKEFTMILPYKYSYDVLRNQCES